MNKPKPPAEKLNLRLPAPLKQALQAYADEAGISLNTACVLAVQNFLPFAARNLRSLRLASGQRTATAPKPTSGPVPKAGRNEPCPCGSGKKYKHCHGTG